MLTTPKFSDLLNGGTPSKTTTADTVAQEINLSEEYTEEQLQQAWNAFAEQRKGAPAEYHLLTQPFERNGHNLTIVLHAPVEETILETFRSDLTTYLRAQLRNTAIIVTGQLREVTDERKMLYTDREKLDYLLKKNPMLQELKNRLELDTDY